MERQRDPMRVVLAALVVASAVLFAVGTTFERTTSHSETKAVATAESGEATGEGGVEEGPAASEHVSSEGAEDIFGINPESPALIAVAVALSVVLAIGVLITDRRALLVLLAGFALAFAAFDAREAVHQTHEGRHSIVAIALVLVALHVAVAALCCVVLRRRAHRTPAV